MIIISAFRFRKVVELCFALAIFFMISCSFSFGIVSTESVANELAYHLYKNGKANYAYIGASTLEEKEKYFNENKKNVMEGRLLESFKENKKPFGVTAQNASLNESLKFFSDIAIIAVCEKNKNVNSSILKQAKDKAFYNLFKNAISPSLNMSSVFKKMKAAIMNKKEDPNVGDFLNLYNIMLCAIYGSADGKIDAGLELLSVEKNDIATCRRDLEWYMKNWDMVEAMKIVERQSLKPEENVSFWDKVKSKIEEKIDSFKVGTVAANVSKKMLKKFDKLASKLSEQNPQEKSDRIVMDSFVMNIMGELNLTSEATKTILNRIGKYTKEDNTFRIDRLSVDRLGYLINMIDGRCKLEVSSGYLDASQVFSHQIYEFNSYNRTDLLSGILKKLFIGESEILRNCDMTKLITFKSESNEKTYKELSISLEQLLQLLKFYSLIADLLNEQSKEDSVIQGLVKGSTIANFGSKYCEVGRVKETLNRWLSSQEI